ncbi:MAG TPA: PAS domain S-box protein, partial [Syntrophomonas sp.]|nr:PAS domain S-box protein [Syntrophomonas sp.]
MNIPRKNDLQIDCDVYDIGQKLLPELEHDDALIIPANIDFEDFIPGHEHQIENSQASARMPEALIVANQNLLNNQMKLLGQLESLEEREEQINNAYQQLAAILDFLPDATGVIDQEGKVTVWNRAMEELTGVKAEDILGKANHAYSLPFYGRRQDALIDLVMMPLEQRQKYPNVKDQNNILTMEKYFPLIKSGSFLECKAACLFDKKGNKMGAIESIRDVSRQKQIENAARTSEARYRNVLENIEEGYYEVDLEGNYTFCNPYLMNYLGMDPERVPGLNFRELMDKENANKVEKAFNRVFKTRQTIREFGWYVQIKEGGIIYVETTVSPILENDRVIGFRGLIRDLSERREAIDKLEYMSMHDSLTGLYNRFYFEEEMRRLESGRLNPVALILFDVDGLKLVNDTLGHDKGDQVLL